MPCRDDTFLKGREMKWLNGCKIRQILFILVLALGLATVFAFDTAAWSQTAEWTVYNTANSGLPYNGVTGLVIDAQGIIWIGTGRFYAFIGGGLAKFDGQNWTVYNTSNSGLPNNDHVGLSIDAQGNIWSGTENGLSMFDRESWTVYKTHNSGLPDNQIGGATVFDAEGNAWTGTGGGLVKFDGQNWTVYNTSNSGLPGNLVACVVIDAQQNKWVGTWYSGLAKFDGENWTVYSPSNSGLPSNITESLAIDNQGNLWIGTIGGGLAKFDGENWTVYNKDNSMLPNNDVWNLAIDVQENIWVATLGGGLAKFDGENWTVYNIANSGLPDNRLYSLAFDAQGSIWIGTESGGLAVYRPKPAVDFNGDEIVNIDDLLIFCEHFRTDEPLCDIAPPPFGDGIVDVQDLEVLMSYWGQEFLPSDLIAYWKLDEAEGIIAHNSAGNYHDANVIGDPLWQPDGGMIDGALQLDGIDDYISTPFVLNPARGKFSVLAWIKGGAHSQVIVSQEGGANWLMADPSDGKLMTALSRPASGRIPATPLVSESIITDNTWHRIGFVWDGLYRHLYVDGVEVAKDAVTLSGLESAEGGLYLGASSTLAPDTFFSGLIDDVRIYNRAITP